MSSLNKDIFILNYFQIKIFVSKITKITSLFIHVIKSKVDHTTRLYQEYLLNHFIFFLHDFIKIERARETGRRLRFKRYFLGIRQSYFITVKK